MSSNNIFSLNPVLRNFPVMRTLTPVPPPPRVTVVNPIKRQALALPRASTGVLIRLPLDPKYPDAYSILAYLNQLGDAFGRDPTVREYTRRVLPAGIANNDVQTQVNSVTRFVKRSLRYVPDPDGTEYVISPIVLLGLITSNQPAIGDCDDHVLLLNSMLGSLGIPARAIGVKLSTQDRFDHVISQAKLNGAWVDIDPCAKGGVVPPLYAERLVLS
jgi:transglutaminase-like putative cysteine protease